MFAVATKGNNTLVERGAGKQAKASIHHDFSACLLGALLSSSEFIIILSHTTTLYHLNDFNKEEREIW